MKIMARPDGPGSHPSDQTPSGSGGKPFRSHRAALRDEYRPETGWYMDRHGQRCHVIVREEATLGKDGSVYVDYGDAWTCAFFRTFRQWGYRRVSDERAQREDAKRLSPKGASAAPIGETPKSDAPIPSPTPEP